MFEAYYLKKLTTETVKNMIVFRFADFIFSQFWRFIYNLRQNHEKHFSVFTGTKIKIQYNESFSLLLLPFNVGDSSLINKDSFTRQSYCLFYPWPESNEIKGFLLQKWF